MQVVFYINPPEYLAQWFIDATGGVSPVKLPKGSPYSAFLRIYIRHKKERESFGIPPQGALPIIVPAFPGKDPLYHNFLPERAKKVFCEMIRDAFDQQIFRDMSFIATLGKNKSDLIFLWMEEHGIEPSEKNFCAVAKRLQLLKARAADRVRKKRDYKAKKSENEQRNKDVPEIS